MFTKRFAGLLNNTSSRSFVLQLVRNSSSQTEPSKIEKTINQVTLLGRVGGDPQKKGNDEHPLAVFSLATHLNYRYESGEFMQRVEWHRIVVFKPALRETVLNYLKKGQRCYVAGRLSYGEMKGEDGKLKSTTSVVADDVFNSFLILHTAYNVLLFVVKEILYSNCHIEAQVAKALFSVARQMAVSSRYLQYEGQMQRTYTVRWQIEVLTLRRQMPDVVQTLINLQKQ